MHKSLLDSLLNREIKACEPQAEIGEFVAVKYQGALILAVELVACDQFNVELKSNNIASKLVTCPNSCQCSILFFHL